MDDRSPSLIGALKQGLLAGLAASPSSLSPPPPVAKSTHSGRSRRSKAPAPVELIVPSLPAELTEPTVVPPLSDLAERVDRLQAYISPTQPAAIEHLPSRTNFPIPYAPLRRLLRLEETRLDLIDLEEVIQELCQHYKNTDKQWITRVCNMLGQAKTYQFQVVSLSRTMQNMTKASDSGIAYLEALRRSPFAEINLDFELPLHLADIEEKAALVLEHEPLITHVCSLIEKIHLATQPEDFLEKLSTLRAATSDSALATVTDRLARVEERARAIRESVTAVESRLTRIAQRIAEANQLYASIRRLELVKAPA